MTEIGIQTLEQHPAQKEIYGDEPVDMDLVRSIKTKGILQALILNERYQVLSGNRRWKAALKAGLKVVPAEIRQGLSETDQQELIIESNFQRVKTPRQVAREAKRLKEIETARAKARRAETLFKDKDPTVRENISHTAKQRTYGQKGRSSDTVGARLGMSGRQVEKLIEVEEKIKELEEKGETEAAKKIEQTLNKKSINAAHAQVKPKPAKPRTSKPPKQRAIESLDDVITPGQAREAIWDLGKRMIVSLAGGTTQDANTAMWKVAAQGGRRDDLFAAAIAITAYFFPTNPIAYLTKVYNNLKKGNGLSDKTAHVGAQNNTWRALIEQNLTEEIEEVKGTKKARELEKLKGELPSLTRDEANRRWEQIEAR